jgi:hypothetical protein
MINDRSNATRTGFELVYTMTDYYDGPRRGVADYVGMPHLYESEWDDLKDDYAFTFRLSPIGPDVLKAELEAWAIWRRWETAFHQGLATIDTHPALPEDRARYDELALFLADHLQIDDAKVIRAHGEFEAREDPDWSVLGFGSLQVRWTRL